MADFHADKIKKILIIRWGGLGDLALCSAVIDDLVHAMPAAEFHLHTQPPWQQLFASDPRLSKVWDYPIRKRPPLEGLKWWLRLLREQRYDLIVDLQVNDRSWLLLALARILGRAPRWIASRRSGFPYTFRNTPHSTDVPAIELLRMPLKLLGIEVRANKPVLYSSDADIEAAHALLAELHGAPFGIVVPGCSAAGAHKRWGANNYIELSRRWLTGGEVMYIVILGAADEADVCAEVAAGIGDTALNLCGQTSLTQILPVVKQAQGLVSNDTGVAHIAAAAGIPMVVICGPTLALRVKPLGNHVKALQIDPACFKTHTPEDCMARLGAAEVLAALQAIRY